jgi:excisionase family DNA binding protein
MWLFEGMLEETKITNTSATAGGAEQMAFTAAQAARALNTSVKTIYRLCQRGLLKRCRGLRTLRIPRSSIEDFLK